jgi:diguanylate cyclase (GGDEF)-like protein
MLKLFKLLLNPRKSQGLLSLLSCLLIGILLWFGRTVDKYDNIWSDFLLACQSKPTNGSVILVAITSEDVIAHGQERLSRKFLADGLKKLNQEGVKRIIFDFTLASLQTSDEARLLEEAFRQYGKERLGIAYDSEAIDPPSNEAHHHCQALDLSFTIDADGRIRTLQHTQGVGGTSPYAWLQNGTIQSEQTSLDRRLDPQTIPRINLSQLSRGEYPPNFFLNKSVVICYDRNLSKTRANLPVHGGVDRGTVIALATESRFENYNQRVANGDIISLAANIVFALCSYLIGAQAPNLSRALWTMLTLTILCISLCWYLSLFYGVPTRPATILMTSQISLYLAFAYRLRILELLGGLISGVNSPEEVWLWRIHSDRQTPAILFDAMGHIKKANPQAINAFKLNLESKESPITELAFQCMPKLGERATKIRRREFYEKTWEIEWPSPSLPLAIFHDTTAQEAELAQLKTQLHTDPLTGESNRAGFERILATLNQHPDTSYALFFMDMNGFKAVNDTYGHEAGDILLKVAAQRFRSVVGPHAFLARLGGDEFAIMTREFQNEKQLIDLRDNIEACLVDKIDIGSGLVKVGVAVGYAHGKPSLQDSNTILRKADLEMYHRKAFLKSQVPKINVADFMESTASTV